MRAGEVTVVVQRTRSGKPRVSTHHLIDDTLRVHAALTDVGVYGIVKELSEWPRKRRDEYVRALRRRELIVEIRDLKSEEHR
jgi:hypothetical protein